MMTPKKAEADDIVRTTLRMPRAVWRAVHIRALDERSSIQDLVLRAIAAYLKAPGK